MPGVMKGENALNGINSVEGKNEKLYQVYKEKRDRDNTVVTVAS